MRNEKSLWLHLSLPFWQTILVTVTFAVTLERREIILAGFAMPKQTYLIGQRRDQRTILKNIKTITERAGRLLRRLVSKKRERGDTTVKDLRDLLKNCNY